MDSSKYTDSCRNGDLSITVAILFIAVTAKLMMIR